jgi:hypothetical protein
MMGSGPGEPGGGPADPRPGNGPEEAADRADYDPDYDPAAPVFCEVCGAEMYYTASCKLRCPRCGYTRDCSDP